MLDKLSSGAPEDNYAQTWSKNLSCSYGVPGQKAEEKEQKKEMAETVY